MKFQWLIGSAAFALACGHVGASRSACNPSGGTSDQYLAVIRLTLDNTYRRMAFRLPAIAKTDVHPVSDPAVCARAIQAMVPLRPGKPLYTSLYVYQIGTSYSAIDTDTDGDYDVIYFFDSTWHMSGSEIAQ